MTISAKWSDLRQLDGQRLLHSSSQHAPAWAAVLFVVLLGWQLARLVWLLAPAGQDTPLAVAAAGASTAGRASSAATGANVRLIADAHLFGKANAADTPVPTPTQNVENLEETRLSLTLMGTIASTDDADAIAIIADARKEEKIYSLGDAVAQGATLHAVYPDRVVLNRAGALEVLKLPRDFPEGNPRLRRGVSRTPVTDSSGNNKRSIQNVVAQNVTKLADVIRPTPYFVGGQQQGYRVYPGRDRRQFAALGLRPGDLIKDINGAALTDPQQAMQIFQSLGTADQVSVTVERNGQPQVLVLNTNQLDLDNKDNDK